MRIWPCRSLGLASNQHAGSTGSPKQCSLSPVHRKYFIRAKHKSGPVVCHLRRTGKLSSCCITGERWLVLAKDLDNSWLWRRSQSNQFHPDCVFSISKYTLPTQILQSERVPKFGDLVCLVNRDTCCQFVSVVWLRNSLGPDAYVNAQEGRGGETCQCGFLFCHLSSLQPPRRRAASWRWNSGNPGLRSPRVHVNHYITFTRHTERHKNGSKSQFEAWLGYVWLPSLQISGQCGKAMKDYWAFVL